MYFKKVKTGVIARYVTLVCLATLIVWGVAQTFWEIRPFWIDEWRIIYNLKTKTASEIMGKLEFMQQFPRVYLALLRWYSAQLQFSYLSLRLPSLLVGTTAIIVAYRFFGFLFPGKNLLRYLPVMMLVSCSTFTEYYVEIKQYSMDLLLSVVVLWQLHYVSRPTIDQLKPSRYILLCMSFLVAPFFSYAYPMVVAPVYLVVLITNITNRDETVALAVRLRRLLKQWLPLFLCTFSATIFYVIDLRQVRRDKDMYAFWSHLMAGKGTHWYKIPAHFFHMMAQSGSGFFFWWLAGILCTIAFVASFFQIPGILKSITKKEHKYIIYSILLFLLIASLNISNILPMGEPRLNAYAIPATSILLVTFAYRLGKSRRGQLLNFLSLLFFVGLCGNIFTTISASLTGSKYKKRLAIYRATEAAVTTACARRVPIMITPGIAWPYDHTRNYPYNSKVPGDWVLVTFPAYHPEKCMPVYAIADTTNPEEHLKYLPGADRTAMVGDGLHYRLVTER